MWIRRAAETGRYKRMQVDFVGEAYTDRPAIEVGGFEYIRKYPNIGFDAHLMVTENDIQKYVKECKKTGFERIIVQMESVSDAGRYKALSIDIHSPIRAIEQYLPNLDYINVMSIEPGYGGQSFDDEVFDKIGLLANWRRSQGYQYLICVDGGVERSFLPRLSDLGVDEVVVGVQRLLEW